MEKPNGDREKNLKSIGCSRLSLPSPDNRRVNEEDFEINLAQSPPECNHMKDSKQEPPS